MQCSRRYYVDRYKSFLGKTMPGMGGSSAAKGRRYESPRAAADGIDAAKTRLSQSPLAPASTLLLVVSVSAPLANILRPFKEVTTPDDSAVAGGRRDAGAASPIVACCVAGLNINCVCQARKNGTPSTIWVPRPLGTNPEMHVPNICNAHCNS